MGWPMRRESPPVVNALVTLRLRLSRSKNIAQDVALFPIGKDDGEHRIITASQMFGPGVL
jgi:hypothetical protein